MLSGSTIRKIRKIYRLSQKDVARITGISESMVSMIESGARQLPDKVAERFSEFLELTPEKVIDLLEFYQNTEVET
ncbi:MULTISPECIES: helix-turn-helix domain-containing protein [Bacillus]|uniref:helix-turn-helix domain-containing protein n=1 Tax=Bacillus TaxID=1386 RepID=UPI00061749B3|nr:MULTISPECIES: helix-turn-helix transcriptional regulator [Bacillus]KKB71827.1 hypothetical protein TH62_19640 [Bacillus sp. TH008]WKB78271.1 helix-turn-helix transcriptional regulator [Bacillus glycinifermentans]SCA84764.1 BamHI control element [Bacillus glycinifermentans]